MVHTQDLLQDPRHHQARSRLPSARHDPCFWTKIIYMKIFVKFGDM